jgi:hypothetical protein
MQTKQPEMQNLLFHRKRLSSNGMLQQRERSAQTQQLQLTLTKSNQL